MQTPQLVTASLTRRGGAALIDWSLLWGFTWGGSMGLAILRYRVSFLRAHAGARLPRRPARSDRPHRRSHRQRTAVASRSPAPSATPTSSAQPTATPVAPASTPVAPQPMPGLPNTGGGASAIVLSPLTLALGGLDLLAAAVVATIALRRRTI